MCAVHLPEKRIDRLLGWLFFVELLIALWGFTVLYDSLFGNIILFGVFRLYFPLIIISIIFLIGGEFYLYIYYKKRKIYKKLKKRLEGYNELLSESSELKCLKCNAKSNLETSKFSWKALGDMLYLGKLHFNKDKTIDIPLCQKCSLSFEYWNKILSRKKSYQIIAGILFLSTIFFVFSTVSTLFIITLVIGILLLRASFKMLDKIKTNPNSYIKNDLISGITVKPEKAPSWVPYDDWIKSTASGKDLNVEKVKVEGKFICEICNAELEEGVKFCTQCGWSLKD